MVRRLHSRTVATLERRELRPTPRVIESRSCPHSAPHAFVPIMRIGGANGWYATAWFWKIRGLLDTLRGGVGLRRGRRDHVDLRVGDTVDFWRVERLESDRFLRLVAEMKIPGRLWLQFEVDPHPEGGAQIRQTTVFDPAGYIGLAYWYLLSPVHQFVFSRMLRGISRAVAPPSESVGPSQPAAHRRERSALHPSA